MSDDLKVLIVEDDPDIVLGCEQALQLEGIAAESTASAEQARPRLGPGFRGVVVSDIRLPGMDGMAFLQEIMRLDPELPVVLITGHGDVSMAVQAMKAGAMDFLAKPICASSLLRAVDEALARSRAAIAQAVDLRDLRARYEALTGREQEVMSLVVRGLLNKQVGTKLGICEVTVKAHRGNAMRKMGARTLPDLVNMASRLGED